MISLTLGVAAFFFVIGSMLTAISAADPLQGDDGKALSGFRVVCLILSLAFAAGAAMTLMAARVLA